MHHHMNSPGALNVKAGVKTREHNFRREHCMSREPPGYDFEERVLLPNILTDGLGATCSQLGLYSQGLHQQRYAGYSFCGKDCVLYETTTGASGLLPGTRRRNHPTSRPPIKSIGLEIELTKRTVPS